MSSLEKISPNHRIFGLIIGIDKYLYSENEDLTGCVEDATSMQAFLINNLHVPASQIVLLCDMDATRANILSSFKAHFTENPKIHEGDAIIFFYAGHGGRTVAPQEWNTSDRYIETIIPHNEGSKDSQGDPIAGIPDRTVNALLRNLASVKGNNITVIFDSCHSGGITREALDAPLRQLRARFTPNSAPISSGTDKDIWLGDHSRNAAHKLPSGFRYHTMSSHVLLAACRAEEQAFEDPVASPASGVFSAALLQCLKVVPLESVTYWALFDQLNTRLFKECPSLRLVQNPQCEGENKDRVLFDGKSDGHGKRGFKLIVNNEGQLKVDAGRMHGVDLGTELLIQDAVGDTSARINDRILVAQEVWAGTTILGRRPGDSEFAIQIGARAFISRFTHDESKLRVYLEEPEGDSPFQGEVRLMSRPDESQHPEYRIILVDSRSDADVVLRQGASGDVIIERLDPLLSTYADRTVHIKKPGSRLEHLPFILDAVAHFKYHLERHHLSEMLRTVSAPHTDDPLSGITIQIHRLSKEPDDRVLNLDAGNLLVDNHANLVSDEEADYGIAIVNKSGYDLFPYLFYFDPSDYSIQALYLPPSPTMSPPLRHMYNVTIGYAADGYDPVIFFLHGGAQSDTGFLKLFVSTKYRNLEVIAQESPSATFSRGDKKRESRDANVWGSWISAITVTSSSVAGDSAE